MEGLKHPWHMIYDEKRVKGWNRGNEEETRKGKERKWRTE